MRAWTRYRWPTTPQTTAGMAGASCPVGAAGCPEQPFPTAAERPHSTDPGRQPSRPAASTPRSTDPRQQELTGAGARPVGRKCDVLLLVTLGELPDPDGLGDDRLGDAVMYDGDIDGDGAGCVALRNLEDAVSQAVVPQASQVQTVGTPIYGTVVPATTVNCPTICEPCVAAFASAAEAWSVHR